MPGHIGAVNMTVVGSHSNVHFQVSAVVVVDGVENEGARSEVTEDSTVFVPSPSKSRLIASVEVITAADIIIVL